MILLFDQGELSLDRYFYAILWRANATIFFEYYRKC